MSAPPVPADEKTSKGIPTRRILFAALGVTACASLFEWASWRGYFDFRNLPPAPGAADAYRKSLARLDDPDQAAGQVIHIGHSTHLLSIAGVRMLTDPWFYDPAFGALSHQHGPAVAPKEIGRLDAILVTHDHADHFDERAIDQLDKNAAVLVATDRLAARSKAMGFIIVFLKVLLL